MLAQTYFDWMGRLMVFHVKKKFLSCSGALSHEVSRWNKDSLQEPNVPSTHIRVMKHIYWFLIKYISLLLLLLVFFFICWDRRLLTTLISSHITRKSHHLSHSWCQKACAWKCKRKSFFYPVSWFWCGVGFDAIIEMGCMYDAKGLFQRTFVTLTLFSFCLYKPHNFIHNWCSFRFHIFFSPLPFFRLILLIYICL